MVAHRQHYSNVHVVFRKDVKIRWADFNLGFDYFGEWSRTTDKPHGRGIYFGSNAARVGYFKNGEIEHGKVLKIVTGKPGIHVLIGTEEDLDGQIKFEGIVHPPAGNCGSGTWIDNVKQ